MRALLASFRTRILAVLGGVGMYRLVLFALILLTGIAFAVSFTGRIVATPASLTLSALVLLVSVGVVDVIGHAIIRRPLRLESGAITALILLFVLFPTTEPAGLAVLALAGAAASASKFALAPWGRHLLNPAAFGAAVVTVTGLGSSMWWVGTPQLAIAVLVLGLVVIWRAEKLRIAVLFMAVAILVGSVRGLITAAQFGLAQTPGQIIWTAVVSSPVLFAGLFMITEPLTLPHRRRDQIIVALVAGALAGWPFALGAFVMFPEVAILVGNLLAFALAFRSRRGVRLTLARRRRVTPSVEELVLHAASPVSFTPGQYVELEVPHRRSDARGTRREFSIVSRPGEDIRIAYRVPDGRQSSFKSALGSLGEGARVSTTGIHGDFTLPADDAPVLLVAAGIGVTPFVSQLRSEPGRDAVLLYVVSSVTELAYADELATTGARVIVVARDASAQTVPAGWGTVTERLTAASLPSLVADLPSRHAMISGPPRLIAELAPALSDARSVRTDAFAGY